MMSPAHIVHVQPLWVSAHLCVFEHASRQFRCLWNQFATKPRRPPELTFAGMSLPDV